MGHRIYGKSRTVILAYKLTHEIFKLQVYNLNTVKVG
nr:MAG TPA: hypothetical protein [Caudoviricetes sp.]